MPVANLSLTSQKLYNCISGKKFCLDTPEFPDFVKAIEYSIATPGRWCYERLKEKAKEFGKPNPKETYLRITLGENNGESPGVPYVMEIWPPGHYSPIHDHGGSSAVIRVLSGSINVTLFPFLGTSEDFSSSDFKKDDVTWISPTLNQVHQLVNLSSKDTCITIQCYMYERSDTTHYDYFDYLDSDNKVEKFEPDSDMEFLRFKETMRAEWNEAGNGHLNCVVV
jgi:predicted metal-dependent enzyme (double-stranded beta helix superfamily)